MNLYKLIVRYHLEYANSVQWCLGPSSMIQIERIERVQKRATKQIPGFNKLTYPERLKKLKLLM